MSWQERCLTISKIYSLKRLKAAENGEQWGMAETAELLGSSKTNVHYCITIARELNRDKNSPLWKEPTMADAWKLVLRAEQEDRFAELRRRELEMVQAQTSDPTAILNYLSVDDLPDPAAVDLDKQYAKERYLANSVNDPTKFEEYYTERQAEKRQSNVINLSSRFVHGDCIPYMLEHEGRFDHIITDSPYAIEMSNLAQEGDQGMIDIDMVEAEHDVEENKELMQRFFPAAFRCLKEDAYCVVWCDQMNWNFLYDVAKAAGFKVQRWPITWNKTHRCVNQAAQYNFTKSTEIAMVCRKGNAVLMEPAPTSVVTASNEDMRREINHPFVKPAECTQFIAKHISFQGQHILDPFAGRGSIVLALMRYQRSVFGVEINQGHYNALIENVKNHCRKADPNARFI